MIGKLKRCLNSLISFILKSQPVLIWIVCVGSFASMVILMSNHSIMLLMLGVSFPSLGKPSGR